MTKKNIKNTKGDLAKKLLEIVKSNKVENFEELVRIIESQKDFLQELTSQNNRSLLRQILKTSNDLFMSKESIERALESNAISQEIHDIFSKNYESLEKEWIVKREKIEDLLVNPGNVQGFINKIVKGFEYYSSYVENSGSKFRNVINAVTFDVRFEHGLPEHRINETILDLLKFDFSTIKPLNDNPDTKGFIPEKIARDYNLGVKIEKTYFKKDKILRVNINVIDTKTNENRVDAAFQINAQSTVLNFMEHFKNQYLINSITNIDDFTNEADLIKTLYIEPITTFFNKTLDESLLELVKQLQMTNVEVKTILKGLRADAELANKKNPLLEGVLSIVEEGSNASLNKGESIGRISKEDVIQKLFQGKRDRYELHISTETPKQVPLDPRVSIFRYNSDDERIDFLIMEYGITKTKFWAPIDKTFVGPAQFITTWELSGNGNKKSPKQVLNSDGTTDTEIITVSSELINPEKLIVK